MDARLTAPTARELNAQAISKCRAQLAEIKKSAVAGA
jgi:hypothetical protein